MGRGTAISGMMNKKKKGTHFYDDPSPEVEQMKQR